MASLSSAYDVFLSFRGTDTRNNFTGHLHKALCDKNIKVFIDNSIERGEEITPFLEGIIEGVKLSIIVFSSDYATSPYCLDEMVKIIGCEETKAQIVFPIFYKVHPSEEIYKEAFARHEQTIKQETMVGKRYEEIISKEMKVERWRSSFQKALEFAGWHIDDNRNEATVIDEITRDVLKRLNCQFEGEMKSTQMVGKTSEDYLRKIMQCLMNDENPKVGVWGMGGVGKTTMVTHINNRLLNNVSFSRNIYWVTVSKDSSIYKLQGDIAKEIKLDLSREDNESKRAAKLFNELKRIKKFVLILDDVWEPFEIEEVGIPLMGEQKLLLTTRNLRVCQRMMCHIIEVKPLCELDAQELFMEELRSPINDSQLVQSIVKECAGLPLAIVVVARTMRGVQEIWKWRNTLRELQNSCEGENSEIEDKVHKVLKFSYDRLSNDRCRQCLLYCSLFPENHKFNREDLIEYWISVGLINEVECRQTELDKGNVILDELIHASLLEIVRQRKFEEVSMHDVIRDMIRMNAKNGLQFESVHVLKMLKSFLDLIPYCFKLKTLLLQQDMEDLSGRFFVNMKNLNVLHITHANVKSIPESITNLGNLRLLIISHCFNLECILSLIGLENLRHLKISYNRNLKEIPKGIEGLVKLRVLDLSKNRSLNGSFPSCILEKLSDLQTLNLEGNRRVEVELEALVSLQKLEVLKVDFYNLHKLNCYLNLEHWRRLLRYHVHYIPYGEQRVGQWESTTKGRRMREIMYIKCITRIMKSCLYANCEKEMWSKIMIFKAIRDVEECKGEFGMFLPDDIRYLKLIDWESPMFYHFKNLNFVNLQSLKISRCKSRYLFTLDLAQHLLHNLQELDIHRDCCESSYELEEIIGREQEWVDPSNYTNYPTILLPNLKTLKLRYLCKLRSIYSGRIVCPSLEFIWIIDCDKIERLPFCKENTQNPTIKLGGVISSKWWNSLHWYDPNVKSMYLPTLDHTQWQLATTKKAKTGKMEQ